MEIKIEFTDKEITPWGGMILMKKLIEKTKINGVLERLPLPSQNSNRGYNPVQLINNFWVSLWSGASRFEHLEVTRMDKVIQKIFGWKRMAGHKSFQRYFKKFGQADNQRVFTELFNWFFKQIKFDNYTLDLDSTIMTRYGKQQGAKKGYNPKKPGRNSHHPLIAFVAEVRMTVNFWLRSGNSYTTNNFYNFLENTFERLEGKTIGLLRADSGFYDKKIFEYLENRVKQVNYIIAAKFYRPLKLAIAREKTYLRLDDGIEISDTTYQSPEWEKPRRMIIVRQEINTRPKATGKQLRLFGQEEVYKNYRYSCFITNLSLSAKMIWDAYRNRADAENRIKELKEDFGAGSFNVEDFFATEAALNFVMMGYNLMSLFRQAILNTKTHQQLKTLRYRVFAIGSYITKDGNDRILKLSLAMKRRSWFEGLWANTNLFSWPFVLSNKNL
ncbi:MAG: IS1380 family transposase [Ignavibacteriota bacterium]